MLVRAAIALFALTSVLVGQGSVTGEVVGYTINGQGEVTEFVLDTNGPQEGGEVPIPCVPPSAAINDDIRQAYEDETDVTFHDNDDDGEFDAGDELEFH